MKKTVVLFLAILMIFSSAMLTTSCSGNSTTVPTATTGSNITTTTATSSHITTTECNMVTTGNSNPTTITVTWPTPPTTGSDDPNRFGIDGVRYDNENNWEKVVNGIFTSDMGGLQIRADGWMTYGLYGISIVPDYFNEEEIVPVNAICVYVFDAEPIDEFGQKTLYDFQQIFPDNEIESVTPLTVSGYPAYKVIIPDVYYAWIINTPNHKYFINFVHSDLDKELLSVAEQMIKTVRIFK